MYFQVVVRVQILFYMPLMFVLNMYIKLSHNLTDIFVTKKHL